jgi:hypothetical protein
LTANASCSGRGTSLLQRAWNARGQNVRKIKFRTFDFKPCASPDCIIACETENGNRRMQNDGVSNCTAEFPGLLEPIFALLQIVVHQFLNRKRILGKVHGEAWKMRLWAGIRTFGETAPNFTSSKFGFDAVGNRILRPHKGPYPFPPLLSLISQFENVIKQEARYRRYL